MACTLIIGSRLGLQLASYISLSHTSSPAVLKSTHEIIFLSLHLNNIAIPSLLFIMASSLVDPQDRARLRDKYKQATRSIIRELQSRSKPAYTHTELAQFRVSAQSIDPEDHKFTDSEACLFQPLTQEELETFRIDKKALSKVEHHYLTEFKDTFHDITDSPTEDCEMWDRASQILFYLEVFESHSERKRGRSTSSIQDLSHWTHIK